ncbi:MAG: undecaprenyldiphospho-muramoylpentapeptide beta-N-acetylglucosaminyltransferase [Gammaproteobacteria bacterium]
MRVIIMAGGTGGHVFPALAIARVLRLRGDDVLWLGTQHGLEVEKVPAEKFPIFYLPLSGLRKKNSRQKIIAIFQLIRAIFQAIAIIRRENPDIVLGMGGYASGPGGIAAWLLRKPLIIHEQNAVAGLTNRLLSPIATRVFTAFPNVLPKGITVGNPVHENIAALPSPQERFAIMARSDARRPIRLLILGGSLGAQAINQSIPQALALIPESDRPLVRHQTGIKHLTETQAIYQSLNIKAVIEPFIEDMATAYGEADLVICRAGALTVAELAAAGIGSILIPYPHAVDDHQTKNGEILVQAGAAVVVQQTELTPEKLAEIILILNHANLLQMAIAAYSQRNINATEKIVEQIKREKKCPMRI